ncbi:CHAP domain-containing protein [Planobispora takensis]|uniref:Peptidase C51 domain-containing protein n=1 Tax=Planobispora takensis TaxID=1367882 RepID=A0A8J3T637_9ACTN|nr:CHAP domain-containing protein [Planobispora takensis]GII06117.1 hypothetical protein Pta02_81250 [Planobispora takensis]
MTFAARLTTRARLLTATLGLAATAAATLATGGTAHADSAPAQPSADGLAKVSAEQLLKVAEEQIGVEENGDGGGTKFHAWYMGSQRAKETVARDGGSVKSYANAPWCAMFVSWVGEQVGLRPSVGWDAYTVTYAQWFKDNGRFGTKATPGSVVFFDWDQSGDVSGIDHVGLVKKDNGDGTITTIEGNTGNGKVEQRVRPKSQVTGYGYPKYAS